VQGDIDPVFGQKLKPIGGESYSQQYIRDLGMKAVPYLPTGQSVPILVLVPENIEINDLDALDKAAALAAGLFFQKLIWERTRVENFEVLKDGVYDPKQSKFQQAVNAVQQIAEKFPFLRMGKHLFPLYNLLVRPDITHYQGEIAYKVFCRWGESIRQMPEVLNGSFAFRVGKLCEQMTDEKASYIQTQAFFEAMAGIMAYDIEQVRNIFSPDNKGKYEHSLRQQLTARYNNEDDKFSAFLRDLQARMGDSYSLTMQKGFLANILSLVGNKQKS
jgi:hypothetical protein